MKFVFVCCVFIVAILNDAQAQGENIVAADQNIQSRANRQGGLIIDGGVVAAQNAQSRSSDQVGLIPTGIVAAEQAVQNQAGQNKLQSVVQT